MHVFHVAAEAFAEREGLPETLPPTGWLWIATTRREFEVQTGTLQSALQRWTGAALFEPHVADLLNNQLPSHYDYTSWYDILVFRRLAAGPGTEKLFLDDERGTLTSARQALSAIDTSPVGFALFDRVLITVHPTGCQVLAFFIGPDADRDRGRETARSCSLLPAATRARRDSFGSALSAR